MWLWPMKIPPVTVNRAIQGNLTMQVTQPGGLICKCIWFRTNFDSFSHTQYHGSVVLLENILLHLCHCQEQRRRLNINETIIVGHTSESNVEARTGNYFASWSVDDGSALAGSWWILIKAVTTVRAASMHTWYLTLTRAGLRFFCNHTLKDFSCVSMQM